MHPFSRQKGCHGPRRSMRRPRKLGTRTRHCSLVTEFGVLRRKFWQVSHLILSSRIQRCHLFPKGSVSSVMLKTFSWDNNWADRGTDKNRQTMIACGFSCYYLKHCSKTNHIAKTRTTYENVYGLVASHKFCQSPNFKKYRLSVTWIKYLTSKLVSFVVGRRKNVWFCRQIVWQCKILRVICIDDS